MAALKGMRGHGRRPVSLQRLAVFLAAGFLIGLGAGYMLMGAAELRAAPDRAADATGRRRRRRSRLPHCHACHTSTLPSPRRRHHACHLAVPRSSALWARGWRGGGAAAGAAAATAAAGSGGRRRHHGRRRSGAGRVGASQGLHSHAVHWQWITLSKLPAAHCVRHVQTHNADAGRRAARGVHTVSRASGAACFGLHF